MLSDYDHQDGHHQDDGSQHYPEGSVGHLAEPQEHHHQAWLEHAAPVEPETPSPAPRRARKKGPKPMTDQPTVRFEGQLYPKQYERAKRVEGRLKLENRAAPSAERRRLTINTLVRVGMAIVLEHESALHGRSEEEILEALRASIAKRQGGESR